MGNLEPNWNAESLFQQQQTAGRQKGWGVVVMSPDYEPTIASVGKRTATDQPLTEHDVAERLDRAAVRLLRIMMEFRQMGMVQPVMASRYMTNSVAALAAEIELWGIEPQLLTPTGQPGLPMIEDGS